jgi:hypothetical protein
MIAKSNQFSGTVRHIIFAEVSLASLEKSADNCAFFTSVRSSTSWLKEGIICLSKWRLRNDKAFSNTDRPSSCQEHEAYLFDIHPHLLRIWVIASMRAEMINSHEIVQYISYSHRTQH